MEENTQLPKEVVDNIENDASAYADSRQDHLTNIREYSTFNDLQSGYTAGATAYASKLYQADQKIKELERWKAEAICLLSKIDDYTDGHPEIKLGMGKVEFTIERAMKFDESAAGREDDNKAQFDALQNWLSEGGYSFDGEYYYDDENNFFTPDQIWEKFKQQKEK